MSSAEGSDGKPWDEFKDITMTWEYKGELIGKQVDRESRKVEYDPEKDTNWCHLPVEMRLKCVSEMDFQEKFHLRNTSTLERSLVDSKEMHFDKVKIEFGCRIEGEFWRSEPPSEGYCLSDYQFIGYPDEKWLPFKKALRNTARLLKLSTVDTLVIEYEGGFKLMPEIFEMNAPFRIKKISSDSSREPFVFKPHDFFIENCERNVEEIDFLRPQCDNFYFENHHQRPEFPNISKFRIDKLHRDDFCGFFKTWLFYQGPKSGTEMEILVYRENSRFEWLLDYARDRKISSSGSVHRFRTNDSKKELVVTIGEVLDEGNFFSTGMTPTITFKIVEKKAKKRTHAQSSSAENN